VGAIYIGVSVSVIYNPAYPVLEPFSLAARLLDNIVMVNSGKQMACPGGTLSAHTELLQHEVDFLNRGYVKFRNVT